MHVHQDANAVLGGPIEGGVEVRVGVLHEGRRIRGFLSEQPVADWYPYLRKGIGLCTWKIKVIHAFLCRPHNTDALLATHQLSAVRRLSNAACCRRIQ